MTFTRTIENFICGHCGEEVTGTGYTNHCPRCLYSKHVDINPGDRAHECNALMQPVGVELVHGQYTITHKCTKCGIEKHNKKAKNDSMEAIIKLAGSIANS